jgi:hypothetical protein
MPPPLLAGLADVVGDFADDVVVVVVLLLLPQAFRNMLVPSAAEP